MNKWLKIILILIIIAVVIFIVLPLLLLTLAAAVFVINPSEIGTEGCTGFQRLPIGSFQFSQSGLNLVVTNETGRNLSDVSFEASFDTSSPIFSNEFNGDDKITVNADSVVSFNKSLSRGDHTVDLTVKYNDGDFPRSATGACRGSV